MKNIKLDCYAVESLDVDGWKWNHSCYVTTKELAKEIAKQYNVIKKWPHRYVEVNKTYKILTTIEEAVK